MAKQSQETPNYSRRNFAKTVVTSLGAIPLASLIASQQGCQTEKGKQEIRQTSPIIVGGGGSVAINFDKAYYEQVPGTNKFVNKKGDYLHKLRILNKFSAPTTPTDPTPRDPNCRIVIHCVDPSAPMEDIPIIIYGSPMGIEFDPEKFKPTDLEDTPGPVPFNPKLKITNKIQVFEGAATVPTAEYNVPTNGICTVDVLDRF